APEEPFVCLPLCCGPNESRNNYRGLLVRWNHSDLRVTKVVKKYRIKIYGCQVSRAYRQTSIVFIPTYSNTIAGNHACHGRRAAAIRLCPAPNARPPVYFTGAASLSVDPSTLILSPCLLASFKRLSMTTARCSCLTLVSRDFFLFSE